MVNGEEGAEAAGKRGRGYIGGREGVLGDKLTQMGILRGGLDGEGGKGIQEARGKGDGAVEVWRGGGASVLPRLGGG